MKKILNLFFIIIFFGNLINCMNIPGDPKISFNKEATEKLIHKFHNPGTSTLQDFEKLLKESADPNSAIFLTTNVDLLKLLLKYGADPNQYNERGHTPLIRILFINHPAALDIVQLLLNNGANPNLPIKFKGSSIATVIEPLESMTEGDTPLIIAVKQNNLPIVALLLNKGVNVNDKLNRSALCIAHFRKNNRIYRLLLEKGADIKLLEEHCKDEFKDWLTLGWFSKKYGT